MRALADAPAAFGTTHAEAMARPDGWWRAWAEKSAAGDTQAKVLAWDGDDTTGIAGVFATDDGTWQMISMWVDPSARRCGAGSAPLDAVVAWARERDATRPIGLSVADGDDEAWRLDERYGFADSGVTEPLRSNSALTIRELELR